MTQHPNFIDISGRTYGKLTAIKRVSLPGQPAPKWLFRCECGVEVVKIKHNVTNNPNANCGCTRAAGARRKHGFFVGMRSKEVLKSGHYTYPDLYPVWCNMKQTCFNKNSIRYKFSGAKGISVDPRWLDFNTFFNDVSKQYYEHVAKYGKDRTKLSRIDWQADYGPDNFIWVTPRESRQFIYKYRYDGKAYTQAQLEEKYGVKRYDLWRKLKSGLTVAQIVEGYVPPRKVKKGIMDKFLFYNKNKQLFTNTKTKHLEIINFIYGGDRPKTLTETGERYGLTRERVRQIINTSFRQATERGI